MTSLRIDLARSKFVIRASNGCHVIAATNNFPIHVRSLGPAPSFECDSLGLI